MHKNLDTNICFWYRLIVSLILVKYQSTGDGGGCCFQGALGESAKNANDNYHRSCICPTATTISECENLCSKDKGCKGYVQHSNSMSCVLATASLCPPSCHGPYKKDVLNTTLCR